MSTIINSSNMVINQMAKMDKLMILKVNSTEFILLHPNDRVKKGKLPFDTSFNLVTKTEFIATLDTVDHKGDWLSLMLADMLRTKILPTINA